jgi:hypothetical protein
MEILNQITIKGLTLAKINGLLDLQEIYKIPFEEKKVEDFIKILVEDLFEFSTSEQFSNYENLFMRAFEYTYGKGFEFALSYMVGEPLERISYNFDNCMTRNGLSALPNDFREIGLSKIHIIREMFSEMFGMTKGEQSKFIDAGISFQDCIIKILNGAFFIGRRIASSIELDSKLKISLNSEIQDCKYDYDNYDQRYST